jgi:hypothetical protein
MWTGPFGRVFYQENEPLADITSGLSQPCRNVSTGVDNSTEYYKSIKYAEATGTRKAGDDLQSTGAGVISA